MGLHTALSYSWKSTDTEEQEGTRRNRTFVSICVQNLRGNFQGEHRY